MECGIAQVVPVGDTWSAECCIAVSQLLAERIITVHLVETLENGHTHAVDIKLSMGEYIGGEYNDHNSVRSVNLSFRKVKHDPHWAWLCNREPYQRHANRARNP